MSNAFPTGRARIGVIGAGVISDTYLKNLTSFPDVEVIIVGDQLPDRAQTAAEKYGVAHWGTGEDVINNPDVDVVVNLTTPDAHIDVSRAAIDAGKHVWSEKPLGLDRDAARELIALAKANGVRIGTAPDTILGPGFQTAKRAIADGVIGTPLFVQTSFQTQGPDAWHPDPAFLFANGAGPLLDIGPYYFSALVSMLGPVAGVAARGSRPQTEREVKSGPKAGEKFPVEVPSTVQVVTSLAGGQHGSHTLSFDSALERQGIFEIHGSDGTLVIPDPNQFVGRIAYVKPLGTIRDLEAAKQDWIEIENEGDEVGRGLGVLDMVRAIAEDRPHVASGDLAYHVLDIMLSAQDSAENGQYIELESTVDPVPLLPEGFAPYTRTLG